MNILIVSPWLPHPGIRHAGGQSLYHKIRSLAERGHTLHVLAYGRGEDPSQHEALASLCASLTVVTPARTWRQKLRHALREGWRHPRQLGRRTHRAMGSAIDAICRHQGIDVVHLAWTEMGRYLDAVPDGVGTVLDTQDIESQVRPRELALYPRGRARWQAARRARRLIDGEQRYVPQADIVLACSQADGVHLARLGARNPVVVVAPWIGAADLGAITPVTVIPGRLTFMGAMDRQANMAAARFLIAEVWPLVRADQAYATLRIVGAHPPASFQHQAAADPRLDVTGFVADLGAEWAQADIAVAPSLIGGGLVVKVAQPMLAGRPVVTTSLGNEGVSAPPGRAIEVADDAPAFAAAIRRLLIDRDHWHRIATSGRHHVQCQLDWDASLQQLEAAYQAATEHAKSAI